MREGGGEGIYIGVRGERGKGEEEERESERQKLNKGPHARTLTGRKNRKNFYFILFYFIFNKNFIIFYSFSFVGLF